MGTAAEGVLARRDSENLGGHAKLFSCFRTTNVNHEVETMPFVGINVGESSDSGLRNPNSSSELNDCHGGRPCHLANLWMEMRPQNPQFLGSTVQKALGSDSIP